ncbi:MAG: GNAT family N-acetyltransferase [Thermoanaerobaculia bacterium]
MTAMDASMEIQHDERRRRFWAPLPHGEAEVDYAPVGDAALDLVRTWVPPEDRKAGAGARLVLHVLEHARQRGLGVIPTCPFVERVIANHPEYQDLVVARA